MFALFFLTLFLHLSIQAEGVKKIGYWVSSWGKQCGIALYTKNLVQELEKKNKFVIPYSNNICDWKALIDNVASDNIEVLNIQYHPALVPSLGDLITLINMLEKKGVRVVITFHEENEHSEILTEVASYSIFHKPIMSNRINLEKSSLIPFGVPAFSNQLSKNKLREKYGFLENQKILTTFGFLYEYKDHPGMLKEMADYIKSDLRIHIQLLTAINDFSKESGNLELKKIQKIIKTYKLEKQVTHITSFLSQEELSERLSLSDLGYLWGSRLSYDTSAAAKEFIAANLPLICIDWSHYHDLNKGVIKIQENKKIFADKVIETLYETACLDRLKAEMTEFYLKYNNSLIIDKHIEIFNKISEGLLV